MNTTTPTRRRNTSAKPAAAPSSTHHHLAQQFEEMPDPLSVVEHLTIPGYIRRAPHRFHLDEITRFGDKVGKIAESMQISYLTIIDRSLGQIRVFPVPLLERVYAVMATQYGWEQVVDVPTVEDRQTESLRANERAKKALQAAGGNAENPLLAEAITNVLKLLETETQRLRGEEPTPETPAPLRSV